MSTGHAEGHALRRKTKHSSKHVCYSSSSTDESSTESEVQSNESTGSSDESLSAGRLEKSSRKRKHSKKEHSHHTKTKRKKISKNVKVKHKHKQKRRSKHREKHKHKHKIKTSTTSPDHTEVASIGMYGPSIGPALPSTSKTIASASTESSIALQQPSVPSCSMAPMTKEEYEKQQSVVRRVYDPETGRNRLVKGDGEIIEEIVSRDQQKAINKSDCDMIAVIVSVLLVVCYYSREQLWEMVCPFKLA